MANSDALGVTGKTTAWRTPVAAAALALALGLPALDAHALALGRVTVQSALGEPLRAEIDVPDINADEAASLKTSVANPEAFKAAGLEYNPVLGSLQISLQRRADGRAFLRVSGDRPVNEPFVDLILEANWASGRLVRDYTMLFDPANLRSAAAQGIPVTQAAVPSSVAAPAAASRSSQPVAAASARPAPVMRPAPVPRPQKPVVVAAVKDGKTVTVKAGNTATQIAARNKPVGVSLDQMLVAMLNANPDAFTNNNLNRLKSGAVLEMPTAAQASATGEAEARQVITAQSKDFNDFRRRLAQGAPTAAAPSAGRAASGSVQAKVEERKPAAAAPDKLTLSKGAVAAAGGASAAKTNKEDSIAKDRQAKEAASRSAEIAKNIQDLNKISTTTVASGKTEMPATAASAAKAGVAIASAPVVPTAPASSAAIVAASSSASSAVATPVAAASAAVASSSAPISTAATATSTTSSVSTVTTVTTTAPIATASAPAAPVVKAPVTPPPEPGLVEGLLDNPVTLPAAGGLLALLAGFGFYRMRQRKKSNQVDSSFLESRLQPDSFFGASGGQRIDTNEASGNATGSSMVYSPSQLDAAGDVDPVAEADVYLAYGRDLQAEEILKEAMRSSPSRVAIHTKLMEIYAKRRDTKAFEIVAQEAYSISKGQGPEWETASALGRELDPSNPLYQPGGMPMPAGNGPVAAGLAAAAAFGVSTLPNTIEPELTQDTDVDFDLDFSLDDNPKHTATSPIHVEPTVATRAIPVPDSFAANASIENPLFSSNFGSLDQAKLSVPDMASFASGLNFNPEPVKSYANAPTEPVKLDKAQPPVVAPLEFDMGGLSLDLPALSQNGSLGSDDPLETKLALASEFREIGDNDGARDLAQEVAAEATGALKARAQRMVAELS